MNIEIKFRLNDNREIVLTHDEARELFNYLKQIYDNGTCVINMRNMEDGPPIRPPEIWYGTETKTAINAN